MGGGQTLNLASSTRKTSPTSASSAPACFGESRGMGVKAPGRPGQCEAKAASSCSGSQPATTISSCKAPTHRRPAEEARIPPGIQGEQGRPHLDELAPISHRFRPALRAGREEAKDTAALNECADVEGLRAKLKAAGVTTEDGRPVPWRRFLVRDPFGNRIDMAPDTFFRPTLSVMQMRKNVFF